MWIAVAERVPVSLEEVEKQAHACIQVKVAFTYEGTAYLGLGMYTHWRTGHEEWSELSEDKNHFTEMKHGVPTHYIILPEIP